MPFSHFFHTTDCIIRKLDRILTLPAHCAEQGRPSVCPIDRQQQRRAVGLLLSALQVGYINRQLRAPCSKRAVQQVLALSSNGAAARSSAANAGSVTLTADGGG